MKKLLLTTALTLASTAAFAGGNLTKPQSVIYPWHAQLLVGTNWLNSMKTSFPTNSSLETSYKMGYSIAGTFGYEFHSHFVLQGELGHAANKIASMKLDGAQTSNEKGNTNVTYGMVNGLYHFHNSSPVVPYIGAGIGVAHVMLKWRKFTSGGTARTNVANVSTDVPAYQGIVGIGYNISPSLMLSLDYRYFETFKGTYKVQDSANSTSRTSKVRYTNHFLNLGLMYRFS